jgi:hypothetical protein
MVDIIKLRRQVLTIKKEIIIILDSYFINIIVSLPGIYSTII